MCTKCNGLCTTCYEIEILNKFSSPTGFSYRKKNFFDGLEKEILTRIFGYKL